MPKALPSELQSEWIDPRDPAKVSRKEKVKWNIGGVEVELTIDARMKRWKRKNKVPTNAQLAEQAHQFIQNMPTQTAQVPAPTAQTVFVAPPFKQETPGSVQGCWNTTAGPGKPTESPLLTAARSNNLLGSRVGSDTFMVLCPWRSQHQAGNQKNGQHDQSTQINTTEDTFLCRHGSCKGKGAAEFLTELGQPVPSNQTKVILVIDDSGSISNGNNVKPVRDQFTAILMQVKANNPKWEVVLLFFGEHISNIRRAAAYDLDPVHVGKEYYPRQGATHLYDAMHWAGEEAFKTLDPSLIYVITDGKPEGCQKHSPSTAKVAMQIALNTGRVSFVGIGPKAATAFFKSCGINEDCIRDWDGVNGNDLNLVTAQVTQGLTEYSAQRAKGKTSVPKFFVDARKLSQDLHTLIDITGVCKTLKVNAEAILQPFVEQHGLTFVVGANFYEHTKLETLRPNRAILVRRKGEKRIYSGPNVRQVLGLPVDQECKIEPGDMGDLELFLESTSHNRVLVRGTDLIVKLDHQGSAHTWVKVQS